LARVGLRHKGREAALRLLYQVELTGDDSESALAHYWRDLPPKLATSRTFAEELARAVRARSAEIDGLIDRAATNWQLDRISRIDLSILRLAVGELLAFEVPVEVIIDEAVELARDYSDANAPAFVNGVLDRIARERAMANKGGA
jgi:N utilization substance protein B